MSFGPDILVTMHDGVTLAIEAKVTLPSLEHAEEHLKRYMVAMRCPVAVLLTPERMFLYKDFYTGSDPSSVQRIGEFDARHLWPQPPPTKPVLFESFVQHWLEEFVNKPHPDLPEELRGAFQEYIEPAIAAGEMRAAHPRNL